MFFQKLVSLIIAFLALIGINIYGSQPPDVTVDYHRDFDCVFTDKAPAQINKGCCVIINGKVIFQKEMIFIVNDGGNIVSKTILPGQVEIRTDCPTDTIRFYFKEWDDDLDTNYSKNVEAVFLNLTNETYESLYS